VGGWGRWSDENPEKEKEKEREREREGCAAGK